jgi:hypothetical protein
MIGRRLPFKTIRGNPEASAITFLLGLRHGYPSSRNLTQRERLTLTLVETQPRLLVTIDSAGMSEAEAKAAWPRLKKRMWRRRPDALRVYVGCAAQARDAEGHHLHLLLWTPVNFRQLLWNAQRVGFGGLSAPRIPAPNVDPLGALQMVRYALGQHQPVFGSRHHYRHIPAGEHKRGLLKPHRATLETHAPEVLSALDTAQSRTVTDTELVQGLHLFSKGIHRAWTPTARGTQRSNEQGRRQMAMPGRSRGTRRRE